MRVLVAVDKFRGTATAGEVADAVARAVTAAGGTVDAQPVADGGEGFLDALGGGNRTTIVMGPLGDPVEARWRLQRGAAVIEMAEASGLRLVDGANDPVAATTYGTGELIGAALDAGARRILVGMGGSATTDGGLGAIRAVVVPHRLRRIELVVACDVRTLFVDAAAVFAPQKGATPPQVALLERRLDRLAQVYLADYGVDVRELEGAGAAGGLAGGLAALGGDLVPGFEVVSEELELRARAEEADLIVTGEGFVDEQSFEGKVVGGVAELGAQVGVPVLVVAGEVFDGCGDRLPTISLTERFGRDRSLADATGCIEIAVGEWLARSAATLSGPSGNAGTGSRRRRSRPAPGGC
jgi:glycerate kinase